MSQGMAQLWGEHSREGAAALIDAAHSPANPQSKTPERQERLASGELVQIRPVRVSDEDELQDLLYELSDESTFLRLFGQMRMQKHQEVLRS